MNDSDFNSYKCNAFANKNKTLADYWHSKCQIHILFTKLLNSYEEYEILPLIYLAQNALLSVKIIC